MLVSGGRLEELPVATLPKTEMPVPRAEQRRHIAVFVLTAYALSIMLSFVIGLTGGYRSKWIELG